MQMSPEQSVLIVALAASIYLFMRPKQEDGALGAMTDDIQTCRTRLSAVIVSMNAYTAAQKDLQTKITAATTSYNTLKTADTTFRNFIPFVECYKDKDLGGAKDTFRVGSYSSVPMNDAYTSIRMSPWSGITMYKNAIGSDPKVSFKNKSANYNVINLTDWSFNDMTSSLVVVDYRDMSNPALDAAKAALDALNAQIAALKPVAVDISCPLYANKPCTASTCAATVESTAQYLNDLSAASARCLAKNGLFSWKTNNCAIPCQVGPWSDWTGCDGVMAYRNRSTTVPASGGGTTCPALNDSKPCSIEPPSMMNVILAPAAPTTSSAPNYTSPAVANVPAYAPASSDPVTTPVVVPTVVAPPTSITQPATVVSPTTVAPPTTFVPPTTVAPPAFVPPATVAPPATFVPPTTVAPPATFVPPTTVAPPATVDPSSVAPTADVAMFNPAPAPTPAPMFADPIPAVSPSDPIPASASTTDQPSSSDAASKSMKTKVDVALAVTFVLCALAFAAVAIKKHKTAP